MDILFFKLIKERINDIFINSYNNRQRFIIWDKPYIYEDLTKPHTNITLELDETREFRAYSVQKILSQQKCIKKYYNCPIKIDGYVLSVEPMVTCFEDHIKCISAHLWTQKITVYIDGLLFNVPNMVLSMNFINYDEYVVHICSKDETGKLTILHHLFKHYHR